MVVIADSGIKNWEDLCNKLVATSKGSTTIELLEDRDKVRVLNLTLIEGGNVPDSD